MKVNVIISNPPKTGRFATVKLSFEDISGNTRSVDLHISFQSMKNFSNDTTSISFDFFLVSSLIYGIDNLLERHQYSIDGWARDIEVTLPVNNLQIWNDNKELFNQLLNFLTGDYWTVNFENVSNIDFYTEKAKRWKSKIPEYNLDDYTFASLFSGGLDSLVGVIDGLNSLDDNKKGLLLSHFDSSSPGANSDQQNIINFFAGNSQLKNKYDWIQCVVALDNHDNNDNEIIKEASFRSRSLLFIGISLFCVEKLPHCNVLTVPENGTISINYPLTPSRSSTLSTRTTHPHYISQLQTLLNKLGLTTNLKNPYKSLTKGQLVQSCNNSAQLKKTYHLSVSCGKRGRKMHWDTKAGTHHCGICMPCIYRRAALHALNLDDQLYGIDIFSTPNQIFDKYDFPALFDFLNSNLTSERIRRTLLVSGAIPLNEMDNSVRVVEQVREEIKQWIEDKGNNSLKKLAGIQ